MIFAVPRAEVAMIATMIVVAVTVVAVTTTLTIVTVDRPATMTASVVLMVAVMTIIEALIAMRLQVVRIAIAVVEIAGTIVAVEMTTIVEIVAVLPVMVNRPLGSHTEVESMTTVIARFSLSRLHLTDTFRFGALCQVTRMDLSACS